MKPITREDLRNAMHSTGLLHQIAYEDPDGWDGGVMDIKITKLHEELFGAVATDGVVIKTAFHGLIEAPKTVSWDQYTRALNAAGARWRKRLADVEAELAREVEAVAELNQRLIERQESFTAQVVRIEGTWRERLRADVKEVLLTKPRKLWRHLVTSERGLARALEAVRKVWTTNKELTEENKAWQRRCQEKVGLVWQVPGEDLPKWTGRYLVELHDGTHTMVRVEEGFDEYEDGEPADRDEWRAWAEVPGSGKGAALVDTGKVSGDNSART